MVQPFSRRSSASCSVALLGGASLALASGARAADRDLDGLDDATEATLGTDPNLPDTDGDRFSDGGEVLVLATDPLVVDPVCEWPLHPIRTLGVTGADMWPADMDADGDLDVLELHPTVGTRLYANDGLGGFTEVARVAPNYGPTLRQFARNIDFDADGDEDVLVGEWDALILYENLGGWRFANPGLVLLDQQLSPRTPSVVDMDLDGDLDIVLSTCDSVNDPKRLWLVRNRGDGSFAPAMILAQYQSLNQSWVADLDNDGWPDIIVRAGDVFWYRNLGPGQPMSPPLLVAEGLEVEGYGENNLQVVDLDGDGWKDLTFANRDGDVSIVWNLGGGTFGEEVVVPALGPNSFAIQVWPIDMDVDGDLDVAVSRSPNLRDVGWVENRGGRVFLPYVSLFDYPNAPAYVLVGGDFDGDGDDDLLPSTGDLWNNEGWRENIGVGDLDADGLDARDEVCYVGSDAAVPDTDAGGVMDGVELQVGRDPLDPLDDGDLDGDGFPTPLDCDDADPDAFPGAPELCGTGADEDCDGVPDDGCPTLASPVPGLAGVQNTFAASDFAEGATVRLVFGLSAGTTPIPGCPGKVVEMTGPKPIASAVVDAAGQAVLSARIPPGASGRTGRFQAVDLQRCEVSNLVVHAFP